MVAGKIQIYTDILHVSYYNSLILLKVWLNS